MNNKYSIYDKKLREYVDLFYIMLVDMAENTVIPEMYEIFGEEAVTKFLDIFAGTTITVPPADVFGKSLDKIFIFARLYNSFNKETLDIIKKDYNLKTEEVLKMYTEVENKVKEYPGAKKYVRRDRKRLT